MSEEKEPDFMAIAKVKASSIHLDGYLENERYTFAQGLRYAWDNFYTLKDSRIRELEEKNDYDERVHESKLQHYEGLFKELSNKISDLEKDLIEAHKAFNDQVAENQTLREDNESLKTQLLEDGERDGDF